MPYITQYQLNQLKEIARVATMETAGFNFPGETVTVKGSLTGDDDGTFDTTEMIRDRTRIWRETWIVNPLQDIIADLSTRPDAGKTGQDR